MDKRSIPPKIQTLIKPPPPAIQTHILPNGLTMYELRAGTQPIIKLEIMFRAGRPFESNKQVGRFTNHIMREGTLSRNAARIAEQIDFYGASLLISESMDYSGFTLFCLRKHLPRVLPILADVLTNPNFDQLEIDRFRRNALKKLQHDLSKNDFVAFREITNMIFGDGTPYGYNSTEEIIEAITRDQLIDHYKKCYTAGNGLVFISGKTDDAMLKMVSEFLGTVQNGPILHCNYDLITPDIQERKTVPSKNKHQLAIRLGCRSLVRTHPDFHGLYILNTILGGYFGSRLMTNIREDKGYTYNIYSSLDTMLYDASMTISLEADAAYLEDSFKQIHQEMNSLCQDLVPEEELKMVKNYLLGYLMTALDGPLNASELIKSFILEGQNMDDFNGLLNTIIQIDSTDIRDLAQRYLNPESFAELVVGI